MLLNTSVLQSLTSKANYHTYTCLDLLSRSSTINKLLSLLVIKTNKLKDKRLNKSCSFYSEIFMERCCRIEKNKQNLIEVFCCVKKSMSFTCVLLHFDRMIFFTKSLEKLKTSPCRCWADLSFSKSPSGQFPHGEFSLIKFSRT